MANSTIAGLTALTSATIDLNADLLPLYDASAATTTKITTKDFQRNILEGPSVVAASGIAKGVYFDGITAGQKIQYNTTANALIGYGDFTVYAKFKMPAFSGNAYGSKGLFAFKPDVGSSATPPVGEYSLEVSVGVDASGNLGNLLVTTISGGGTRVDTYREVIPANFASKYAGKIINFAIVKTQTSMVFYVNGEVLTQVVTNVGNVPLTNYLRNLYTSVGSAGGPTSVPWSGTFYNFAVYSRALSLADIEQVNAFGIDDSDQWARAIADGSGNRINFDINGNPTVWNGIPSSSTASNTNNVTITAGSTGTVVASSPVITVTAPNPLLNGDNVTIAAGGGIAAGTYFVRDSTPTSFSVTPSIGSSPTGATVTGGVTFDVISSSNVAQKTTATGSLSVYRAFNDTHGALIVGKRYRVGAKFTNNTGETAYFIFSSGQNTGSLNPIFPNTDSITGTAIANGASGYFFNEFEAKTQNLYVTSSTSNTSFSATTANTQSFTFTDLRISRVGAILNPDLSDERFQDNATSLISTYNGQYDTTGTVISSQSSAYAEGSPNSIGVATTLTPTSTNPSGRPQSSLYNVQGNVSGRYHGDAVSGRNNIEALSGTAMVDNYVRINCNSSFDITSLTNVPAVSITAGTSNLKRSVLIGSVANTDTVNNALGFAAGSSTAGAANLAYLFWDGTDAVGSLKLQLPSGVAKVITMV